MSVTRRDVLSYGVKSGLVVAASAIAQPAFATYQLTPFDAKRNSGHSLRELSFVQTHTGEKATATFFEGGMYSREGLKAINHILRDHRTGEVEKMDRKLVDMLFEVKLALGTNEPFHIISGYRSPQTNAMLASKSHGGVAKKSLHMLGQAIDIRVPGIKTSAIRDLAKEMQVGGVGYYSSLDFVHLDTGRVRSW